MFGYTIISRLPGAFRFINCIPCWSQSSTIVSTRTSDIFTSSSCCRCHWWGFGWSAKVYRPLTVSRLQSDLWNTLLTVHVILSYYFYSLFSLTHFYPHVIHSRFFWNFNWNIRRNDCFFVILSWLDVYSTSHIHRRFVSEWVIEITQMMAWTRIIKLF